MSDTPNRYQIEGAQIEGTHTKGTQSERPSSGELDAIGRLLRLAGPRPSVPRETEDRVRARTHQVWRQELRSRRRRRYLWPGIGVAAAAGLAFALISRPGIENATEPSQSVLVARLQAATGTITQSASSGDRSRRVRSGEALFSGSRIDTGTQARAALTLTGGASLRLDTNTRLLLAGERVLVLERGAIYFDSVGDADNVAPLEIQTDLGVIRDIGTQFEVRRGDELTIRVREGLVHLDSDRTSHEASVGVELRVSAAGTLSRRTVPIYGPSWDWILDVAPTFALEGHTLDSFLAWVSRETGWTMEFVDRAVADSSADVVLHGSIEGLRPDRALDAVLPTCSLEHRFEGGILLIQAETR